MEKAGRLEAGRAGKGAHKKKTDKKKRRKSKKRHITDLVDVICSSKLSLKFSSGEQTSFDLLYPPF